MNGPPTGETNAANLQGHAEADAALVDGLAQLIEAGQQQVALAQLAPLPPADIAAVLGHLPFEQAQTLFDWLPLPQGSEVLSRLGDHFRIRLLTDLAPERIAPLVDSLDADEAADLLADLPGDTAHDVLARLADAETVAGLLGYGEETAGGIMGTEYVVLSRTWTVAQATEELRRHSERVAEALDIFVVDSSDRLDGSVSLKCLLLSPPDAIVGDVMNPAVVSVHPDLDQEEVARLMDRLDLLSLPVVDSAGRLVGQISIDDVVDVIREEAEEDIQRMSGLSGDEEPTDSLWRMAALRLPWLLGGLVGAGLAALIVGSFEAALRQAVVLAGFIPIVMATAGNVGIQSSAVAVQGLASGEVWADDMTRRLGKEIALAVINGLAAATVVGLFVMGLSLFADIHRPQRLALTAAVALITVILLAATIGAAVPLILYRVGIDPALATGPFITTSNDVLSVLIFFVLASTIYLA